MPKEGNLFFFIFNTFRGGGFQTPDLNFRDWGLYQPGHKPLKKWKILLKKKETFNIYIFELICLEQNYL